MSENTNHIVRFEFHAEPLKPLMCTDEFEEERICYLLKLKSLPYEQYLKTAHWKNMKKKAKWRANNKCQICRSAGHLDVHHLNYENRGEESLSDLMVLCRSCHAKIHNIPAKEGDE